MTSMTTEMELVVDAGGNIRCIYGEALDLREIGKLQITRASHVEPDSDGFWWADMWFLDGPLLGPYGNRTEALGAERGWLVTYQHGIALTACKVVPTKDDPQADHAIAGRAARGWKAPSAPTALACRSVLAR